MRCQRARTALAQQQSNLVTFVRRMATRMTSGLACSCSFAPVYRPSPQCSRRQLRQRSHAARCEDVPKVAEGQEVNIRDDSLANRPAPKMPKGVTVPTKEPGARALRFGFVENAERWNSRAAMIGFIALLILEAVLNKGILELVNIRVGGGLGVEL